MSAIKEREILAKYMPGKVVDVSLALIHQYNIFFKIVRERGGKYGDYSKTTDGRHKITINGNLNKYKFFMTFIHEVAHLVVNEKFGRNVKPHGDEWKFVFSQMMKPFINEEIFPAEMIPALENHFKNPSASSDVDVVLSVLMNQYNEKKVEQVYLFELQEGERFCTKGGQVFQKGKKRVKRYECIEVSTGRKYIFQPHTMVEYEV